MNVVLIYISPNQTTRRLCREMKLLLGADGHNVVLVDIGRKEKRDFRNIDLALFRDADLIGIACPIYHMKLIHPMLHFMEDMLPKISLYRPGLRAFVMLTYAGITSGKALLNAASLLQTNDLPLVGALKITAPHFWHIDGYPDVSARNTIARFCAEMKAADWTAMPWDEVNRRFHYQKPIVKFIYPFTDWIGRRREQPIIFEAQSCSKCMRCVNECPVEAIRMEDAPQRDAQRCIYCYHCTTVCPQKAVLCPVENVKAQAARNIRIVSMEQPAEQIFVSSGMQEGG